MLDEGYHTAGQALHPPLLNLWFSNGFPRHGDSCNAATAVSPVRTLAAVKTLEILCFY